MTLKTILKTAFILVLLIASAFGGLAFAIGDYPRKVFHKTAHENIANKGEWGQWKHLRTLVGANFRAVVRPNQDTIYSSAFVDLSKGAVRLSVPAIDSYYSFAVYDENTDVIGYLASRTHGNGKEQSIVLALEGQSVSTNDDDVIRSSSDKIWVLGRFLVSSDDDYPRIHKIQDALKLSEM